MITWFFRSVLRVPQRVHPRQVPLPGIDPLPGSNLLIVLVLDVNPLSWGGFFTQKLREEALSVDVLHRFWSRSNLKERGQEIRQLDEIIAPRSGRDCLRPTDDQGHPRAPVGHRHLATLDSAAVLSPDGSHGAMRAVIRTEEDDRVVTDSKIIDGVHQSPNILVEVLNHFGKTLGAALLL